MQNIPGGAGRAHPRAGPRAGSSAGCLRGVVRSGACCVGRLQSAWAIVGSSGGSRRVAPADCGLGLRSRGGGGVNAAADRHVTSWCEDRGARAKRLGGDSIRCTERLQPPEPVLQPLVLRACKKGKGAPSRDVQGRSISPNHFIDDLQCARRWRCLSVRAAPLPVQRTPPVAALTDRALSRDAGMSVQCGAWMVTAARMGGPPPSHAATRILPTTHRALPCVWQARRSRVGTPRPR